jgi:hypothetical protein
MIMETIAGERIKKTKLLFDSVAWFTALNPLVKKQILDWIRDDQLTAKGEDEDGDVIGEYSQATEIFSGGRKQEGDPFDLNDTGAFYRSMFVQALSDGLIIDGDTDKMENSYSQKNGNWWHDGILGLNEENLEKLARRIEAEYIRYARKVLEID